MLFFAVLLSFKQFEICCVSVYTLFHYLLRLKLGRYRYLESVSVFGIFVGIFLCRFGIRYRYFEIPRYSVSVSVFQILVENRKFLVYPSLFGAPVEGDMHSVIMLFEIE